MRLPTFAFSFFFFLLFLLSTLFPFLPSPLPLSPSLSLRPFKEKRNCILYAYINRASLRHVFPTYSLNGRKQRERRRI